LLDKEVIFKEDLEQIFGKRPFESEESTSAVQTSSNEVPDSSETQVGNSQSGAEN